jgi:molecular chaperone DnaJ
MPAARDLYEVLGVGRDASADEIKRAYRRLAREMHPDVNGSAEAESRFKEIAGAYEILSDPEKRGRYDAYGQAGGPGGAPFSDIQDIFDLFFGSGGFGGFGTRRRGPRSAVRRGEDLRAAVTLTLTEAAFGVQREIALERLVVCDRCLGNGAEPGTTPIACRTCGGVGEVQAVRRSVFGTVMTATACSTCRGTGQEILDPCDRCRGDGRVRERAAIAADIPAGVSDGMELRVQGGGHEGLLGGGPGDLYVSIAVEPAMAFERRGQDLFTVLDVRMTQAALGAEFVIETLDGPETIKIDPGTESGTVVRVKGRGVPNLNRRGRGDLYVTVHVLTPRDLSRGERKLLEELAELRDEPAGRGGRTDGELRRPEF